ncbi:MAG: hypothetical protein Q9225_001216 [Loekoesia sp. 1 TL-2023]
MLPVLAMSITMGTAFLLALPQTLSVAQFNRTLLSVSTPSTIAAPPLLENWPHAPWSFTEHLRDGSIEFEFYGRRLADTAQTRRLIDQSVSDLYQDLSRSFDPRRQTYDWGVAKFHINLEPRSPATKSEVLEMFFWMVILVGRYKESPTEIKGAILFIHREVKAHFSLTFPGIAG